MDGGCDRAGAPGADAPQRHAEVLGLDHDADTLGPQLVAQPVCHLLGEPLLDLEVAGEALDDPGELGEPEDAVVDAAVLSVEQRYVALDKGMREMFFMGNEVKNSWGTLATTDKLIKENPKMVAGFVRATIKALRYLRQDKEGTIAAMVKFSGVSRQQSTRVYDDIIGTFTRSGVVDDETQRNDLAIIRQVVSGNELWLITKPTISALPSTPINS